MNKINLILAFTLITTIAFGQKFKMPLPTTEEEYNYMTKGYKVQIENGLDMKKGYKITDLPENRIGQYSFAFKALVRVDSKEVAGIIVIAKSNVSGKTYYLGIPHQNEILIKRHQADIEIWDRPMSSAYAQIMSIFFGEFFSGFMTEQLQLKK